MKMYLGSVPIKSMKIKHYEVSTNDCTAIPSDLQSGVTCVAKGKKITGTGKCFSFASYGTWFTNESVRVPSVINTVQIGSMEYPVKMTVPMSSMCSFDFATPQEVAEVIIDGETYPMSVSVQNGNFLITCEKTIGLELFYGKDEYV